MEEEALTQNESEGSSYEQLTEACSRLSMHTSNGDEGSESGDDVAECPDLEIPSLNENDEKDYLKIATLIEEGKLDKLKVEQCKLYLRKHGLRLSGKKAILIERIQEHLEIKDGSGKKKYPKSSFVLNCKGDACTGDIVMFEQKVYEMYSIASRSATGPPIGTRCVVGRIVKESYGAAKQQHTFTIEVLWSKGEKPLPPLHPLLIKGRNLYKLQTVRQPWPNEEDRKKVLLEKHSRGFHARNARDVRVQMKETNRSCQGRHTQREAVSTSNKIVDKRFHKRNLERKPLTEANDMSLPVPVSSVSSHAGNSYIGKSNTGHSTDVHSAAGVLSSNRGTLFTSSNGLTGYTRPIPYLQGYSEAPLQGSRPACGSNDQQRKPCRHFLQGRCHYGERCKFFHDTNMLRYNQNHYQLGVKYKENEAQRSYRYY
ncbi:uncharacterized protein LOC131033973 isoform X1 [Cryptomeria japonica]|uniref:uncharacterized protein LOC131033973 isoform X1 n=1 Tax=Cryptomeria japonica TaxID=3369 RepID=UPI0027DA9640|nr:uncharacterized protein LOC131033973 isoform X1 [Cryptomeria japonica]